MADLHYSKYDSQRFGLNIHRTPFTSSVNVPKILRYILDNDVDTAIIRIPSTKVKDLHLLEKTGMPYMIADTLAYYHFDLSKSIREPEVEGLSFEIATPEHHALLDKMVRECYGDYINHYRVSYLFDNDAVTEGYQDWVRSYAEGDERRICLIARKGDQPVAFGTFNLEKEVKMKAILYGVRPAYRNQGILKDFVRHSLYYAREKECEYMRATAQIENIVLQKVWTCEGFELHHTVNTVHINSLLTKSIIEPFSYQITVEDAEQVSPKVSNRYVLQRINREFDQKQNIVTKNHRFVNVLPMKRGDTYTLEFSYPTGGKGLLRIVGKDHETHVLVYFNLVHFVAG